MAHIRVPHRCHFARVANVVNDKCLILKRRFEPHTGETKHLVKGFGPDQDRQYLCCQVTPQLHADLVLLVFVTLERFVAEASPIPLELAQAPDRIKELHGEPGRVQPAIARNPLANKIVRVTRQCQSVQHPVPGILHIQIVCITLARAAPGRGKHNERFLVGGVDRCARDRALEEGRHRVVHPCA